MIPLWTSLIIGLILYHFISGYLTRRKRPPGPTPWPLIGNLGRELKPPDIFRGLEEMAKKFGGICTVHMPFPVVNITDYEILKEALKGDSNIPDAHLLLYFANFSKENVSIEIQMALREYIEFLKDHPHLDAIDMHFPIHILVANVINEFVFGFRYTYKTADPLIAYLHEADAVLREFGHSKMFLATALFPIIRKIPILRWYGFDRFQARADKLFDYIRDHVAIARKSFDPEDEPTNYVHAFLKKARDDPSMTDAQLVACCSDLFIAGQQTTITTSKWAIIFMAAYPKVQERIRAEIRAVTANSRMPSCSDKNKMPFTVATLHEIQRCGNVLAITPILMHRAERDVVINVGLKANPEGHWFPKDTIFNADYHHVLAHDPHFVEADKFNPDRYLMEDGVTLKKELVDRTVPFGMGKRQCAGEGLARMELFLGLTTTVQNFRILPPIGGCVDLEPLYTGTVNFSKPHNLQLVPIQLEYKKSS